MIIFLYGSDSYRSHHKLNEIIEEYKKIHKNGLNLRFFDCEESDSVIDNLKDEVRQSSIFKEKRLNIITNLFSSALVREKFSEGVKDLLKSDDIIVVYEEQDIKKSDPLFKNLLKSAKSQEFKELSGAQLIKWIEKEFEYRKTRIDPLALNLFLDYVGNDLWRLFNEIEKLVNFKNGKTITVPDIKLLIRPKIENDIFKTIDAISQKDKKQALNLLYSHLDNGDSPIYLLSMMAWQFRNILMVKDLLEKNKPYDLIVKKTGLHPFVVKKSYYQSQKFSLSAIKKIYQRIFEVDLGMKTGKIDQEMALDLLIAEM